MAKGITVNTEDVIWKYDKDGEITSLTLTIKIIIPMKAKEITDDP